METNKGNGFIGYEYMEVAADRQMEAVYADSYPSFGWRLDACTPCVQGLTRVTMKFKRDRKIRNKAELTRLQRQFESGAAEIAALEKSKTLGASAAAFLIGIVGTAFMAGSVFSAGGGPPRSAPSSIGSTRRFTPCAKRPAPCWTADRGATPMKGWR